MKKYLPYSLILAAAATGLAHGAATAYTTPVGYVSLGDTTAGQPAIKPQTDVYVSIPLEKPVDFAGAIASISGSVITLSGTPNLPDLVTVPHTIKIGNGAKNGLIATIVSNTATTITVALAPGDSLTGIVATNTISTSPAWTVLGFMGSAMPVGTQLFTYPASSPLNPSADGIFEWDGSNWIDTVNTGDAANNSILYPNETFTVRNQSGSPVSSFVISGQVPTANNYVSIAANGAGGADNAVSYFSPIGEAIGQSGLSAVSSPGDQILGYDNNSSGFNKSASSIHEFDGTNWIDTVNTGDADNSFPVGAGKGFFLRKSSARAGVVWSDQPSYISSL